MSQPRNHEFVNMVGPYHSSKQYKLLVAYHTASTATELAVIITAWFKQLHKTECICPGDQSITGKADQITGVLGIASRFDTDIRFHMMLFKFFSVLFY